MIKFLIEKEFKQLLRNSFLPRLILVFPCMIMLLMPWAVNMEIKNIQLNIVDNDHSVISQRLVNKIAASTYFRLTEVPASYADGLRNIELGTADIVMEIPRHLEKDWMNKGEAHILIAANSVNGTKGGLGSSYLATIINNYATELRAERPDAVSASGSAPSIRIDTQGLFNPNLNYKLYMIPALMGMLLTLICGFLPALNVVSEKEVGTIEQINVTPVPKFTFILAKLLPYWITGFIVVALWNNSCRTLYCDLFFGDSVCVCYVRFRACHIQLFGNYAAIHVCDVLFYVDSDVDERTIYTGEQHA